MSDGWSKTFQSTSATKTDLGLRLPKKQHVSLNLFSKCIQPQGHDLKPHLIDGTFLIAQDPITGLDWL